MNLRRGHAGFTVVELLVIIVVIAILATLTVVAYNGIQKQARQTALTSDLRTASDELKRQAARTGRFPTGLPDSIRTSGGNKLVYHPDNNASPRTFCLTGYNVSVGIIFKVTAESSPVEGPCEESELALLEGGGDGGDNGGGNGGGGTPQPPALHPNLVAAYGFNETSGTTFANQVPGGIAATLWPSAQITAGHTGNAVVGTGGHQAAVISGNPAFNTQSWTGMTVSFWVNRTVSNSYDVVTFWNNASRSTDWGGIYTNGSTNYGTWIYTNSGSWPGVTGTMPTTLNQWVHVAFTWSAATNQLKIYGNGTLKGTTSTSGSALAQNTAIIDLGGSDAAGGSYSQTAGKIDDFRIYNTALSDAEIETDMNTPVP